MDKTQSYIDTTRGILDKLKEINILQTELLVLISQATPEEQDSFEDATFRLGIEIDHEIEKLWILK
jgi:hypothetical protein